MKAQPYQSCRQNAIGVWTQRAWASLEQNRSIVNVDAFRREPAADTVRGLVEGDLDLGIVPG